MCSMSLKDLEGAGPSSVTDVGIGAHDVDNVLKLKVGQGLETS